ncbi:MAG: hypothetical protein JW801_13200 [Bacteroidales bacterium]|nr:hypothetical protein [Bacteroidales bacterium]
MKKIAAILICLILPLHFILAQGEIDEEEKIFFRNEQTYAITLNTHGLSGGFRYARRIDAFRKTIYDAEFAQIKDAEEIKITFSSSSQIGGSFVYGKLNSFGTLRAGIGLQKELFRKYDKGGISIRYFYCGGPSIGFTKPIYYDIITINYTPDGQQTDGIERMKFEPHVLNNILRKAPFYVGLTETRVIPGLYGKFGFTFEFSKKDMVFNALEVGVVMDAYIKKIPIMANENNTWYFPAFFLSYRFGKVIDSQFKPGKNKIDELLTD